MIDCPREHPTQRQSCDNIVEDAVYKYTVIQGLAASNEEQRVRQAERARETHRQRHSHASTAPCVESSACEGAVESSVVGIAPHPRRGGVLVGRGGGPRHQHRHSHSSHHAQPQHHHQHARHLHRSLRRATTTAPRSGEITIRPQRARSPSHLATLLTTRRPSTATTANAVGPHAAVQVGATIVAAVARDVGGSVETRAFDDDHDDDSDDATTTNLTTSTSPRMRALDA
jgi:hypothetical protein